MMVPAAVAVGVLGAGIAQGAVPVSFVVSGQTFTVTATHLHGTNFTQYGSVAVMKNGTQIPVAESAIESADLTNMCQVVSGPFGTTLVLKAGGGAGKPAHAANLVIDMNQLSGDATFQSINIGQDASMLNGFKGSGGSAGAFGQRADVVDIDNVHQTAYATSAGTFYLPGLTLNLYTNGTTCP